MQEAWEGFKEGIWTGEVDVRDFIQKNYTPYEGDESFLVVRPSVPRSCGARFSTCCLRSASRVVSSIWTPRPLRVS